MKKLRELAAELTSAERGTESGTVGDDRSFAEACAAIMQLPLSDTEKAEAIRRLLR
jgi:hypothetical protein